MMNNPGSSASQNCSGPSSSSWANWDQNNGGVSVTALEPRVHYHHHHHNYNTNNSESTSTSTCSRLGWEWDHHNTMLLSHDRQGDGTTDPTKPPMATATLVNSEIRSYFLEGMLPYGNLAHSGHIGQLLSANPSMRSGCFPGMGSSNSGDIQFLGDVVKQENYGGLSRIGLSLGGAYFSAEEDVGFGGRLVKRARGSHGGGSSQVVPMCQAEGCRADLSCAKHYHRRHKVCEQHSKAALVVLGGQNQRFCQQCSRFHLLSEFDDGKRSCRKRLADHNRRRRKPQTNNNNNNNNVARIANDESTPLKEDLQDSASNNPPNGAQAKPVSCPAPQASTPPISLSSPAPLMIQNKDDNNRRQMSVAPVSTHDPMYNRYLHAVNPQTGPKLSLSSSLAAIPMDNNHQWRQQHQKTEEDGKNYEPIKQSCVPWLRQHNINESRSPQNINLQPENSASSNGSCSHAFSPNLLPIQSSRSGLSTSRNWAMNNVRDHSRDQGHSNTNFASRVSPVNLKGHHQVLSLLESSSTFKDYQKGMGRQQKATSSSETESSSTSGSGGDVKAFPDLHNLRPFASPSTYDSNINTALI